MEHSSSLRLDMIQWLESLPEHIRSLATRFPTGSTIEVVGEGLLYVFGYMDDGETVIVTPIDPRVDYIGAFMTKMYACGDCLTAGKLDS